MIVVIDAGNFEKKSKWGKNEIIITIFHVKIQSFHVMYCIVKLTCFYFKKLPNCLIEMAFLIGKFKTATTDHL